MNGILWTAQEDAIILTRYSNTTFSELLQLLPTRTKHTIKNRARKFGIIRDPKFRSGEYITTKYHRNRNFFSEPNLLSAYWAGFIAADGGIDTPHNRVYIKLSNKDHAHLVQFAIDIEFNGPIKDFWETTDKGTSYFSKIVVDSVKQWVQDLEKFYNIKQGKTNNLLGPNLDSNSDLCLAYIAGLIDGDGSILIHTASVKGNLYKSIYISLTGTINILNWVKSITDYRFPILTTRENNVIPLPNTEVVSKLSIGGDRVLQIINLIKTMKLPLLERKWDKTNNLILGRI